MAAWAGRSRPGSGGLLHFGPPGEFCIKSSTLISFQAPFQALPLVLKALDDSSPTYLNGRLLP